MCVPRGTTSNEQSLCDSCPGRRRQRDRRAIRGGAGAPPRSTTRQYPDVDIVYGASLYAARCVTCHGAQGDAIGGVNLRSGKFRNAQTDNDLARFIRAGSQAAGMPPFALDNAEMAGIIAYLRNMNSFDTATREDRRCRARPRGLRRQGRLRGVPSRRPRRLARGARI